MTLSDCLRERLVADGRTLGVLVYDERDTFVRNRLNGSDPSATIHRMWCLSRCIDCGLVYRGRWQPHRLTPEHFWGQVRIRPNGCWEWDGYRVPFGYGYDAGNWSHRRAWELVAGAIPAGLMVLHRCDNPPCVRPLHLFLGTNLDNVRDMQAKGRSAAQKRRRQRDEAWRRERRIA